MTNSAFVQVKGKWTIGVQTNAGVKYIQGVVLVLDIEQNLLSIGQLLEHGYMVNFEENGCSINNKKTKCIL